MATDDSLLSPGGVASACSVRVEERDEMPAVSDSVNDTEETVLSCVATTDVDSNGCRSSTAATGVDDAGTKMKIAAVAMASTR